MTLHLTHEDVYNRTEIGKMDIPTRFYTMAYVDKELDLVECTEAEFLDAAGTIHYERHTMHQNGVNQICLTKKEEW